MLARQGGGWLGDLPLLGARHYADSLDAGGAARVHQGDDAAVEQAPVGSQEGGARGVDEHRLLPVEVGEVQEVDPDLDVLPAIRGEQIHDQVAARRGGAILVPRAVVEGADAGGGREAVGELRREATTAAVRQSRQRFTPPVRSSAPFWMAPNPV